MYDYKSLIMFAKQSVIYLAGGCFWGVEAFMSRLKGVNSTEVGYANGRDRPMKWYAPVKPVMRKRLS